MNTKTLTQTQIDKIEAATPAAAAMAAKAVGFDGTNPQAICGLLFALADVLEGAGYTFADIATMYGNVTTKLHQLAEEPVH
jgi:hypothetical protein